MQHNKKDYSPPQFITRHFNRSVILNEERAVKFHAFRERLCQALGNDNEICNPTNLWCKALDLLLAHESALLTTVEQINVEEVEK